MEERCVSAVFPHGPIPSALMVFSAGDLPMVWTAGWMGVVCSSPAVLSVSLQGSCDLLPAPASDFTINLPGEEGLAPLMPANLGEKCLALEKLGWSLQGGVITAVPVVAECPIRIECRGATLSSRFGQKVVSGTVMAVHLEGEIFGPEKPLDFCRLQPFMQRLSLSRRRHSAGFPEWPLPQTGSAASEYLSFC